jgi:hypothetical protein
MPEILTKDKGRRTGERRKREREEGEKQERGRGISNPPILADTKGEMPNGGRKEGDIKGTKKRRTTGVLLLTFAYLITPIC